MIKGFITSMTTMARGKSGTKLDVNESEPSHLLDLLRGVLLGKLKSIGKQRLLRPNERSEDQAEAGQQFQWFPIRGILGGSTCYL